MSDLLLRASAWLAATPTPTPSGGPVDDQVTPGVVGFVVTFLIAVAAVLLILDMTRRIRRVRYREEIAQKLDAEQAVSTGGDTGDHRS
ncbi:hypothetical protein ATY41_09120 [Leifsonia xyli subsp. xyli]|uniref:Uncharacterized protein n=2 Tax=Leifsonia xyli subsp. xyli TaxID=59736 RepID=Q6ADU0_LEIXX|nr:hypothetical protein [Leifsonia xyli]AAT89456.1 hypothetical protein Lxx16880 [Leifsonia xyli subsp. xyli str. CTCB07]ODA90685.1 hypothetical protein ATY41_09120 [Leifsonia xyli subsp. xyli]